MHICLSMHSMSLEGFTQKTVFASDGEPGRWEGEGDSTAFKHTLAHTTGSFLPHLSVPQPQAASSPFHRDAPLPPAPDAVS